MTHQEASPDTARAIAEALASTEPEERRQAAARLVTLPVAEAIPLLPRALGDDDWRVRKEAATAAGLLHDPAVIEALVPLLGASDATSLRNAVVDVLASEGARATSAVTAALGVLDADGRKLAVEVLGRSRDPGALAAVALARHDDDENVRLAAIEAIACLGTVAPDPVSDILLRCLDTPDPIVQLAALAGLNALGLTIPWARIEALLDDATLRRVALRAAAFSDSPEAPLALARLLRGATPGVFDEAVRSLAHITEASPPRQARRVREALEDAPFAVSERMIAVARGAADEPLPLRAAALVVASVAGLPGALDAALDALDDADLEPVAHRALLHLGAAALPSLLARLRVPPQAPATTASMLEVVAELVVRDGDEARRQAMPHELLAVLRPLARSEAHGVVTAALFAIGRVGTAADLGDTARACRSSSPALARAAAGALGTLSLRHPTAARTFAREAIAEDACSLEAILILGALAPLGLSALGSAEADRAFLTAALRGGDMRVRGAAVATVAELGDPEALDLLGFALSDEEPLVQLAAAHALGRLSAGPASRQRGPGSGPPPSSVLELVTRSNDPTLVAATVDALASGSHGGASAQVDPIETELVAALTGLVAMTSGAVAIAAVGALARVPEATPGRRAALAAGLHHDDTDVVRAAMLKLGPALSTDVDLAWCAAHTAPEVRSLCAEILGGRGGADARARLAAMASAEGDAAVREAVARALEAAPRTATSPPLP